MRWRGLLVGLGAALALPAPALAAGDAGLNAALARQMRQAGGASGAYVVDLTTGRTVYASRSRVARPPASVEKLYTTSTALLRFGPSATFRTDLVGDGTLGGDGVYRGRLWVRGGGDPFLSTPRLRGLAGVLAGQGVRSVQGDVLGDESLFDAARGSYRTGGRPDGEIGALSGVAVDHGWNGSRLQDQPAVYAARDLSVGLRAAHVGVAGRPLAGAAPSGARVLATARSAPLAQVVAATNRPSDNFAAETLLKDLGARFGGAGSTAAGAGVVRRQLAALGVSPQVVDGSGLSRSDLTSPHQVVRLLGAIRRTPVGGALRASLPVAGVSGTLSSRMRGTAAAGRCQAKTGTLSDASALAGYCPTRNGHTLAFAFLMNHVDVGAARRLQDRMTVALAAARVR